MTALSAFPTIRRLALQGFGENCALITDGQCRSRSVARTRPAIPAVNMLLLYHVSHPAFHIDKNTAEYYSNGA